MRNDSLALLQVRFKSFGMLVVDFVAFRSERFIDCRFSTVPLIMKLFRRNQSLVLSDNLLIGQDLFGNVELQTVTYGTSEIISQSAVCPAIVP